MVVERQHDRSEEVDQHTPAKSFCVTIISRGHFEIMTAGPSFACGNTSCPLSRARLPADAAVAMGHACNICGAQLSPIGGSTVHELDRVQQRIVDGYPLLM